MHLLKTEDKLFQIDDILQCLDYILAQCLENPYLWDVDNPESNMKKLNLNNNWGIIKKITVQICQESLSEKKRKLLEEIQKLHNDTVKKICETYVQKINEKDLNKLISENYRRIHSCLETIGQRQEFWENHKELEKAKEKIEKLTKESEKKETIDNILSQFEKDIAQSETYSGKVSLAEKTLHLLQELQDSKLTLEHQYSIDDTKKQVVDIYINSIRTKFRERLSKVNLITNEILAVISYLKINEKCFQEAIKAVCQEFFDLVQNRSIKTLNPEIKATVTDFQLPFSSYFSISDISLSLSEIQKDPIINKYLINDRDFQTNFNGAVQKMIELYLEKTMENAEKIGNGIKEVRNKLEEKILISESIKFAKNMLQKVKDSENQRNQMISNFQNLLVKEKGKQVTDFDQCFSEYLTGFGHFLNTCETIKTSDSREKEFDDVIRKAENLRSMAKNLLTSFDLKNTSLNDIIERFMLELSFEQKIKKDIQSQMNRILQKLNGNDPSLFGENEFLALEQDASTLIERMQNLKISQDFPNLQNLIQSMISTIRSNFAKAKKNREKNEQNAEDEKMAEEIRNKIIHMREEFKIEVVKKAIVKKLLLQKIFKNLKQLNKNSEQLQNQTLRKKIINLINNEFKDIFEIYANAIENQFNKQLSESTNLGWTFLQAFKDLDKNNFICFNIDEALQNRFEYHIYEIIQKFIEIIHKELEHETPSKKLQSDFILHNTTLGLLNIQKCLLINKLLKNDQNFKDKFHSVIQKISQFYIEKIIQVSKKISDITRRIVNHYKNEMSNTSDLKSYQTTYDFSKSCSKYRNQVAQNLEKLSKEKGAELPEITQYFENYMNILENFIKICKKTDFSEEDITQLERIKKNINHLLELVISSEIGISSGLSKIIENFQDSFELTYDKIKNGIKEKRAKDEKNEKAKIKAEKDLDMKTVKTENVLNPSKEMQIMTNETNLKGEPEKSADKELDKLMNEINDQVKKIQSTEEADQEKKTENKIETPQIGENFTPILAKEIIPLDHSNGTEIDNLDEEIGKNEKDWPKLNDVPVDESGKSHEEKENGQSQKIENGITSSKNDIYIICGPNENYLNLQKDENNSLPGNHSKIQKKLDQGLEQISWSKKPVRKPKKTKISKNNLVKKSLDKKYPPIKKSTENISENFKKEISENIKIETKIRQKIDESIDEINIVLLRIRDQNYENIEKDTWVDLSEKIHQLEFHIENCSDNNNLIAQEAGQIIKFGLRFDEIFGEFEKGKKSKFDFYKELNELWEFFLNNYRKEKKFSKPQPLEETILKAELPKENINIIPSLKPFQPSVFSTHQVLKSNDSVYPKPQKSKLKSAKQSVENKTRSKKVKNAVSSNKSMKEVKINVENYNGLSIYKIPKIGSVVVKTKNKKNQIGVPNDKNINNSNDDGNIIKNSKAERIENRSLSNGNLP